MDVINYTVEYLLIINIVIIRITRDSDSTNNKWYSCKEENNNSIRDKFILALCLMGLFFTSDNRGRSINQSKGEAMGEAMGEASKTLNNPRKQKSNHMFHLRVLLSEQWMNFFLQRRAYKGECTDHLKRCLHMLGDELPVVWLLWLLPDHFHLSKEEMSS